MDEYSRATIELLLARHKNYLFDILRKQGMDVSERFKANATVDDICNFISKQKEPSDYVHRSSIYRCSKCSSNMVVTREVQSRSTDEGSTIMYVCNECGNIWQANP